MPKASFAGLILIIACMAASMAAAETINVSDDHGGSVAAYSQRWKGLAARGVNVRIVGKCQSACTVLLGYIPRSRIWVMPAASFGFHLAHRTDMTAVLWNANAADIRGWINAHGGLASQLKWMSAPDTYRYFHRC
ncbi:hypothetical protein [Mesorhizobium sp.]|uniref:hypothetical protein n=1 Tax=Mesorhizobium sp. TaxID=1871066 RepID=UPI000FE4D48D|nr:hypothetical protein [Mesorhizobium sp.]RWH31904.1 MAG: hypothetical protein EOQ76_05725 [Mesorhizobium sp.]RWH37731.1 MAG: hypothetical protein EOQ79_13415 [Mesorhizobium sp.]RWI19162.1 MAG: hypothetical protein EOQ94_19250 [Mesorhizobium sp.]TIR59945.1 MAG: hypothetical protein E5X22_11955 [Mesorhizobium sp.]TIR66704.1 MAG: hypothetical protein E5X24_22655 [Mesorhizobium sp.]